MGDKDSSDSSGDLQEISQGMNDIKITSKKQQDQGLIIEANGTSYECIGRTGKGSFGVVYKAVEAGTNQIVAIKRVLQDPKYKNRELQIMKMIDHPNAVELIDSFYERSGGEVYLNLVLGYVPKNLYEVSSKRNDRLSIDLVRIYMYQLCRSLACVHSLGICHRDIKPQNLLINPETHQLRLCDFGSAKILISGEPNVSYICSRYYRAPELIFGACDYTTAIDVWSSGCVMAELILGQPIFAGESGIDQLVEIIKVLGTPSREEIRAMNPDYKDYKQFPSIKPHPWHKLFPSDTPKEALDLMSKMLIYTPHLRIKPMEALTHVFFDELRNAHASASTYKGIKLPPLFDFTNDELTAAHKQGLLEKLLPPGELERLPSHFAVSSSEKTKEKTSKQDLTDSESDDGSDEKI